MLSKGNGIKVLLLGIFVLMFSVVSFAHCVWVEAPVQVNPGEEFEVLVYFADADDPIEERDMTELQLFLVDSNWNFEEIELIKEDTYQRAMLSIDQPGEHTLIAERVPSRWRTTEIRDFAKKSVLVGDNASYTYQTVGIPLEVHLVESRMLSNDEREIVVEIYYEGELLTEGEIELWESLEEGGLVYDEIAEVEIGTNGQTTFVINPAYNYIVETDYRLPPREVEGTGRFVTEVRFRSTLFLGATQ
ncbi:hypothetical protein [Natronospora cellulosivora (SeqCode)]